MCSLYAGGCGLCLLEVLDVLKVPEVMRRVLLCMLEVLKVLEVMRCVLLCMLKAVEGGLCLLEMLEVPGMLEVMRCVLYICSRLWRVGFVCWR